MRPLDQQSLRLAGPEPAALIDHTVAGGGGCELHLVEAGDPDGRPILFVHGFSQCSLAWARQFASGLALDHRLVALDMRGHGQSARPDDACSDSRLWADDLDAVLSALSLREPILSGWSYGCLVILDYLRHYGEAGIGGIQFVGGVTQLGGERAMSALTPEFLALIPGLLSSDIDLGVESLSALARCSFRDLSAGHFYQMLGAAMLVPPRIRNALFSRQLDNDDLLARLRKPVLLTHGSLDAIVRPSTVERHRALIAHAEVQMIPGSGHAPFWDDADDFNRRLLAFAAGLDGTFHGSSKAKARTAPRSPAARDRHGRRPGNAPTQNVNKGV